VAFRAENLAAGGCSRKSLGRRRFLPAGHAKIPAAGIFLCAFRERFSLDSGAAGPGVDDFGNVLPSGFSPVRFSDFRSP
jgi:hypothetical protein